MCSVNFCVLSVCYVYSSSSRQKQKHNLDNLAQHLILAEPQYVLQPHTRLGLPLATLVP